MICPKCGSEFRVTNTFQAGGKGYTQRVECTNTRCNAVGTVQAVLVNINPGYGEGAGCLAKRLKQEVVNPTQGD